MAIRSAASVTASDEFLRFSFLEPGATSVPPALCQRRMRIYPARPSVEPIAGLNLGPRRLRDSSALPICMGVRMPRFYFDVSDGRCSPDANGLYLTDDMAARREAVRRVAMLLRATHNAKGVLSAWRMAVKDEAGEVLFSIEAPSGAHFTPDFAR